MLPAGESSAISVSAAIDNERAIVAPPFYVEVGAKCA